MSFHARSVAELSRLFVDLSEQLLRGGTGAGLEMIRATFAAEAALLSSECRDASRAVSRELAAAPGSELALDQLIGVGGHVQPPRGCYRMTANWHDEDSSVRYSLRLFRRDLQPDFHQDEQVLAENLLLQLGRSTESSLRRMNADIERTLYSDIIERLQIGLIVLDRTGRLLSISPRASELLESRDGLQLVSGRLCALNTAEDRKLQDVIRAALSEGVSKDRPGAGLSLTKRGTMRKMGVIVRRIPASESNGRAAVSISIRDADVAPDVEAAMMRQIFELTPAEAAVAGRLTEGLSLEDTALALDISHNTARAHLRSIFSKSGIKRQTELVRLVLNSAVVL